MLALANIYLSAKRPIEALQIYNAVLNRDPGNADALNGAIGAAIDAKDLDTARFLVGRALQRDPNSARFVYLAGQLARMSGDNRTALRYLEAARSLHRGEIERQPQGAPERPANPFRDPAASSAPGLAPADMAVRPAPGRQYAAITTGPVASSPELPRIVGALSPTPAVDPLGRDIETSLRDIRTEVAPAVEGVVGYRSRSGESGLSHLSTMDAAATASFSPGYYGRLSATLNPVHLDAGPVDTDPGVQRRFGSGPFQPITTANQKANGVGVGVAYALRDFGADVGLTPLGFPTTARPVGSVSYAPRLFGSQATLKGQLMRRPVTETLLSYSGIKDPGTGQIFGAVLKTGGRLDVEHDDGFFGAYANGSYFTYEGQHVASNTSYEGGVGAFVRPYKTEDQTLKAGVNVTFLSFEKNLGKFTLGHGGYFSPQDYVALSFPVEFTGTADRFKYTLGGALGLQSYNEKSAPYFPVDAAKQASLVALAASDPTIQAVYPSRSQTGVGVNFSGDVQYRLTDTLTLGGRVSYDNFGNYSEQSARLYLKRSFPGTN
jgi:hypothetical protein